MPPLALSKVPGINYRDLTSENRNGKHHLEQPLALIDLVPRKTVEEMIFDNDGSMVKMEKDVKMIVEENNKLRDMV
ncbi:hypothetical protein QQP08_012994 [Theobroma cacao]|nr:hypothetical protein QQP08_012994 [Theobroma cacao]